MSSAYLTLLRPLQWVKSVFVLAGMLYSQNFSVYWAVIKAVISFSLISSAVYIYNDIHDIKEDRAHPFKKFRPLVGNKISIKTAIVICAFLIFLAFAFAYRTSWALVYIIASYTLVNVFYNAIGKSIPWLDVGCIASGFLLRIMAGTTGVGIALSLWLAFTATLLSLYLALSKRLLEKKRACQILARQVLTSYTTAQLTFSINIVCLGCILTYIQYILVMHGNSFAFILSIIPVLFSLLRFNRLVIKSPGIHDDPLKVIITDRFMLFMLLSFSVLMGLALV